MKIIMRPDPFDYARAPKFELSCEFCGLCVFLALHDVRRMNEGIENRKCDSCGMKTSEEEILEPVI